MKEIVLKITFGLIFIFMGLFLTSCSWIPAYTVPVAQGKYIEKEEVPKITPNMTKTQVRYALGTPDIIDIFDPDTYIYVHTYKPHLQDTTFTEHKLILKFKDNRLVNMKGNYIPPQTEVF